MIHPKNHLLDVYRSEPDRYNRTRYIRLDKNEDLCGLPDKIVSDQLSLVTLDDLSAYPQPYLLYDKLSDYLGLSKENLVITMGSDAAIKNVFEVFVSPGDNVIIPEPTYAMYEVYAKLFDAELTRIPYNADLMLNVRDMIDAIRDNTRMVVLANPNSPTGTIVGRDEIVDLIRTCNERDIIVLIDEAYYPYYDGTVIDLINRYPNIVVTRTFSKAFGLAALRLGYAAADPQMIRYLNIFRPMYETHGFAVAFGCAALEHSEYVMLNVRRTLEGREYLIRALQQKGFEAYPTYTNFVNFRVDPNIRDPLVEYLKNKKILIKPGASHPALESCIRITAGPKEKMEVVVHAIGDFLSEREKSNRRQTPYQ